MYQSLPSFVATIATRDPIDVRKVDIDDRMSQWFSIRLEVVSISADIDFEAVIGKAASFAMNGTIDGMPRVRNYTGICNAMRQQRVEPAGLSTYALTIVPTLWLATQRRNYRIFQRLSDVDIALQLLRDNGVDPVQRLSATYKKRDYRVQYGESDYAFISRLLEDAGVSFFFEEEDGQSKLVLSDSPETATQRTPTITFNDEPTDIDREYATRFEIGRHIRPGRYRMRDHDFRRAPNQPTVGEATGGTELETQLERYHYTPGAFLFESSNGDNSTPTADDRGRYRIDTDEGQRMAERRLDATRSDALETAFESNIIDIGPGVVVGIAAHPRRDINEHGHLVTRMTFRAETGVDYTLRYEARGANARYRPPLVTPRPRVNGVESATVVGPAGDEIHTDEFGRVRVHFHWDRQSRMNDESSCWIHASESWAGSGYGLINLPRVGHEVLVDFLSGDPDRPVIVGRVFTNLQRVPYRLPDNKTQSGWKSNSTNNTGGYNELMFEDKAGDELVRIQAERDLKRLVKHDEEDRVNNDRARSVGQNESISIGGNRTKNVARNESEETGMNHSILVGINRSAQIGSKESVVAGERIRLAVPVSRGGAPGAVTSVTLTDRCIVLDTGVGAKMVLRRDRITMDARDIQIRARRTLSLSGGSSVSVRSRRIGITASGALVMGGQTARLGGTDGVSVKSAGTTDVSGTPVQLNGPGLFAGRVTEKAPDTILTGAALVLIGGETFPYPVTRGPGGVILVGPHITIKPGEGRYPNFQQQVLRDLGIMSQTPAGRQRLDNIQNNPGGHNTTITEWSAAQAAAFTENNSLSAPTNETNATLGRDALGNPVPGPGSDSVVSYNPNVQLGPAGEPRPADSTLFHELGHSEHAVYGTDRVTERMPGTGWDNREEWQTIDQGINNPSHTNDIPGVPQSPSENDYLQQRGYPYRRTDHDNGHAPF